MGSYAKGSGRAPAVKGMLSTPTARFRYGSGSVLVEQ